MSTIQVTNIKHASSNTNSIELDSGGAVTLPKVNSINNGPLAGFRNAIINGNFDFWQRGTSVTGIASAQYLADRWTNFRAGSTANVSRQSFTLGQTDVPNEPTYFHRTVVSSVAGVGNAYIQIQIIESVRTFAGQTVTLSFWAKADASKNIAFEFAQGFGTGGSPSAQVNTLGVTTCALTTSWSKFTITTSLPSISGKTLGSDNNDGLILAFWFDAGSNFNSRTNSLGQQSGTFDVAQVQLEAGPVATPFERRPIGTELALCQRYYWALGRNVSIGVATATGFGYSAYVPVQFPARMRVAPTVSTTLSSSSNILQNGAISIGTSGFDFFIQTNGATSPSFSTATWSAAEASAEL
jgi:hypothetical protein